MQLKTAVLVIITALLSNYALAAEITGTIYDFGLGKAENPFVEINTTPVQKVVAVNSTYTLNVPPGEYLIKAAVYEDGEKTEYAEELVRVSSEGKFALDIILFPSFEEEKEIINESDFVIYNEDGEHDKKSAGILWLVAVLAAIIGFFLILRLRGYDITKRRNQLEVEEESENLLEFIRKEGGRTTQKDIRKNFPQSEAKISLMISDLESKSEIRKIKKGRGNIIILNK